MEKNYDHNDCEDKLYETWEKSGDMHADNKSSKKPFTIVLPPPNVTGVLHMGHAAMLAVEDIMIRYKHMTGHEVLWVPGTDHAAIATENVVLKHLGMKKREEMKREEFLEECKKFSKDKHDRIVTQIKKMGSWLDWEREAYTLDEPRTHAVQTMFKKLWDDGLIVRGNRMVNWSVGAQSVLADDEVEHKEVDSFFYHYKYELMDGNGEFLEIATTRPETIFGDTAVALHPDDSRAEKLNGKMVKLPFTGREIPIVLDDYVDLEVGTATLKVTPAHDPNDFEIGERHDLPLIQVIGFDGKMLKVSEVPKEYQGLTREECRKKLIGENEFLISKKSHIHNIGHCYRTGTVIEPMLSKQWFIAVNNEFTDKFTGQKTTLKKLTLEAVKNGHVKIIPKQFEKTYFQWIDNLRDWCISRQIWWGHQIPVWYNEDGKEYLAEERKIIAVRHGQSTDAVGADKVIQTKEAGLSEEGKKQAETMAQKLQNRKISRIFSSSYVRCQETAQIIAKEHGLKVELLEDFDAPFSELAGKKRADYYDKTKEIMIEANERLKKGETRTEVFERIKKGWNKLKELQTEEDIIVVGHRSIFSGLDAYLGGGTADDLVKNRLKNDAKAFDIWGEYPVFQKPAGENLHQDEDTLDTWFSSALWPFSTLGWPNKNAEDLQKFYPNDVMETGHDILFFWVARMIMFGRYATGVYPFRTVYLHGLVTDEHGKKMSKSAGNGIDPLDMISEYGADAVRLSLVIGTAPGNPIPLGSGKISGYRNFVNKLWNAGRFVKMNCEAVSFCPERAKRVEGFPTPKSLADKWIASRFTKVSKEVAAHLEKYEISQAGDKIYHFVWDEFCDWYIEASKVEKNPEFLAWIFFEILILVHPLCPFITEKLYKIFWGENKTILDKSFSEGGFEDKNSEEIFTRIKNIVTEIRRIRSEKKLNPKEKLVIKISTKIDPEILERSAGILKLLGNLSEIKFVEKIEKPTLFVGNIKIFIDIPVDENRRRKEKEELKKTISALEGRLSNKGYVEKAPKVLIDQTKKELEEAKARLDLSK